MSTAHDLIIAVFDRSDMAEHAIKDLKNTGLSNDEILYSSRHGRGGFFENFCIFSTLAGNDSFFYSSGLSGTPKSPGIRLCPNSSCTTFGCVSMLSNIVAILCLKTFYQ